MTKGKVQVTAVASRSSAHFILFLPVAQCTLGSAGLPVTHTQRTPCHFVTGAKATRAVVRFAQSLALCSSALPAPFTTSLLISYHNNHPVRSHQLSILITRTISTYP